MYYFTWCVIPYSALYWQHLISAVRNSTMLQQSSHSQENLKKCGPTLQLIHTVKSVQCAQINIGYDIKDVVNGMIQQKKRKFL